MRPDLYPCWLRDFAEVERRAWLGELERDIAMLSADSSSPDRDLAFLISEKAAFGGLPLAREFREDKLKALLVKQNQRFEAVRGHVRRLYEAHWNDRYYLIGLLIKWESQLSG